MRKLRKIIAIFVLSQLLILLFYINRFDSNQNGMTKTNNSEEDASLSVSFPDSKQTNNYKNRGENDTCLHHFDSAEIFPTLNFDANWTKQKLFWKSRDFDFEKRYIQEQTCTNASTTSDSEQCHIPPVEVFVVPFSHNDPGWLQTSDRYFDTKTRFIIDNAIEKMNLYKDMTFVWSEVTYLSQWFHKVANSSQKRILRELVKTGRFEVLTGGWVMADEASCSLYGHTHQLIEGHHWLKRNLKYKPEAAWSIDPFGHGNVIPYLLRSAGIEGMMIQRIHYAWKHWLAEHKYGDFRWTQRWDDKGIHCLNAPYDLYPTKHACGPTPETCMQFNFRHVQGNSGEHLKYMKPVTDENIRELADALMGQYRRTASLTQHNVVVTGLGNDFEFEHPLEWDQQYGNYSKLFHYIKNNKERYNAKVKFGTLSQYFRAVKNRNNLTLPCFKGDFFPHSDVYFRFAPAYWTGYFSSRPFWKKLTREAEDKLRSAEILYTYTWNIFTQSKNDSKEAQTIWHHFNELVEARRWLALFQHHDAITGTSTKGTMQDYKKKLEDSIRFSEQIQIACVKLLIKDGFASLNLTDQAPLKFNDDAGIIKKVVIFNSHGWERSHLVRVLIDKPEVGVYDPDGKLVTSQINPKIGLPGNLSELVFIVNLPAFALTTFEIRRENATLTTRASVQCNNCADPQTTSLPRKPITLENDVVGAYFDSKSGLLKRIYYKVNKKTKAIVNLTFGNYKPGTGSGAYLSHPIIDRINGTIRTTEVTSPCMNDPTAQLFIVSGPVLKEVTLICRKIKVSSYILQQGSTEFFSAIHVHIHPFSGRRTYGDEGEYFMRFQTNLNTTEEEPVFFTGNDLSVERRVTVSRLPYEANLYPVVNYAYIQDPNTGRRLSILVDRSHGVTSTISGNLEFIYDRRIPHDDARGMSEGVVDTEDTVSNYVILLERFKPSRDAWMPTLEAQRASKFLNYQPTLFVYDYCYKFKSKSSRNRQDRISLFTEDFPRDAFLLHFRTMTQTNEEGGSAGVPDKKALMMVQNLGYMNTNFKSGNSSPYLGTDLRLRHSAVTTDLVGDSDSAQENYLNRSSLLPRGKPYELSSYIFQF